MMISAFQKVFCSPNKNWVRIFERESKITAQSKQSGLLSVTAVQVSVKLS